MCISIKAFKRYTAIILSVLMMIYCVALPVSADETVENEWIQRDLPTISSSSDYIADAPDGSRIIMVLQMTEDGLVELTKEEYAEHLELIKQTQQIQRNKAAVMLAATIDTIAEGNELNVTPGVPISFYKEWGKISNCPRTDLQRRISNYVQNETSAPATLSISASTTQSFVSSISLSAADKSGISATIGSNYSTSETFSQTVTANIPARSKGWIEFYPHMYNTWGNVESGVTTSGSPGYVIQNTRYADMYFPKRMNGQLYGTYVIKQANL